MEAGQYLCAYCGHRSLPPRSAQEASWHAASLAASLAEFEARRARRRSAHEEIAERLRQANADTRQTNGYVLLGIGALFLVFAALCLFGAAVVASRDTARSALGPLAFGLFWLALGGGMFYGGLRYGRAGRRDRRLRQRGLRARATVVSYRQGHLVLDGNPKFELVLDVEVPGRAPYVIRQSDWVARPGAVTTGAELPAFVDSANPNDVMVDWFTADLS